MLRFLSSIIAVLTLAVLVWFVVSNTEPATLRLAVVFPDGIVQPLALWIAATAIIGFLLGALFVWIKPVPGVLLCARPGARCPAPKTTSTAPAPTCSTARLISTGWRPRSPASGPSSSPPKTSPRNPYPRSDTPCASSLPRKSKLPSIRKA